MCTLSLNIPEQECEFCKLSWWSFYEKYKALRSSCFLNFYAVLYAKSSYYCLLRHLVLNFKTIPVLHPDKAKKKGFVSHTFDKNAMQKAFFFLENEQCKMQEFFFNVKARIYMHISISTVPFVVSPA